MGIAAGREEFGDELSIQMVIAENTEEVAHREGVHGWVRNLPDGRVEVAADGDAESIERFERSIRHGPRGARVDAFEVFDDVPGDHGSNFSVR